MDVMVQTENQVYQDVLEILVHLVSQDHMVQKEIKVNQQLHHQIKVKKANLEEMVPMVYLDRWVLKGQKAKEVCQDILDQKETKVILDRWAKLAKWESV